MDPESAGTEENAIVVTVDVSELIGAESYLYVSKGPHSFVARVDAHVRPEDGAETKVIVNNKKMHLFDKDTEKAIL